MDEKKSKIETLKDVNQRIFSEDQIRNIIRDEIAIFFRNGKYVFEYPIQILDGRNIQVGKSVGTKIGTETTQKIAFYGETPVAQGATIADPIAGSGDPAIDQQARNAIYDIIDRLQAIGIIA